MSLRGISGQLKKLERDVKIVQANRFRAAANGLKAETILDVLRLLDERGIALVWSGSAGGGHRDLDFEEVMELIRDPIGFEAKSLGISPEALQAWQNHDWICGATTKKGRRCKNVVAIAQEKGSEIGHDPTIPFDPKSAMANYCMSHLGYK